MSSPVTQRTPFSCFLLGEGTLLLQCGEILLQEQHQLCGIISASPEITRWAASRQLAVIDPATDFLPALKKQPFDYLFSIVNLRILPQELILLPRRAAINFHDGPLPRYAGVHATSWALLNKEVRHGVTWHALNHVVDAGPIYQQRLIDIAPGETAYSLNIKCFEAGVQSFTDLVQQLSRGPAKPCPQDLSRRTYFARFQRPPAAGILAWNQPADSLAALVRALEFGPYPNPLGRAKIALADDFLLCPEIEVLPGAPTAKPGAITALTSEQIKVATADKEIGMRRLLTLSGKPLPLDEVARHYGLKEGDHLPILSPEKAQRISELCSQFAKSETFWVQRLQALHPITLPALTPPSPSDQFAHRPSPIAHATPSASDDTPAPDHFSIPKAFSRFLEKQSRPLELHKSLLAAFAIFLARLTQNFSMHLGLKSAGLAQDLAGLERLFASRVPCALEVDPSKNFLDHYQLADQELNLISEKGSFALDLVARYPKLRALADAPWPRPLPIAVDLVQTLESSFPEPSLELCLALPAQGHYCRWTSNTIAFSKPALSHLFEQFQAFLLAIVAHPQLPIARLPLMDQAQRQQLNRWNNTATPIPAICIHHAFEAQVGRTPDAVALVCHHQQLTYAELNARANQLAHHLRACGVGPDVVVGLAVERSLEMMVGLLGILKSGGAYLPLDPAYPQERVAFMLQDAKVNVLLTQQRLTARLPKVQAKIVCLDSDWDAIAQQSSDNCTSGVTPENLAYLIYTSGSTGKPKGVMVEHRNVLNFFTGMDQALGAGPPGAWLAVTSICFDISVLELFWTLTRGFKVVIAPSEQTKPPASQASKERAPKPLSANHSIPALIRRHGIAHLQCTPSMARMLLMEDEAPQALGQLRQLLIGGEYFPASLAQELRPLVHGDIFNLYGPTETTIWSTFYRLDSQARLVSIGRPIANTQIHIVDANSQPLPIGIPGELLIGGAGVVRGYLDRPELNAALFKTNPFVNDPTNAFAKEPQTRLYRTGDQARFLPDGNIEFLGRIDHQVKIRGHRIELGEIEAVLNQHPAVSQSVVTVREDAPGKKKLVAYLIARSGQAPRPGDLRDCVKEKLPDYMVPAQVIVLKAFPQTPNGKIDRKNLPAPEQTVSESDAGFEAPVNAIEAALADFWAESLRVPRVGRHANFFEIGGDSLSAFQTIFRIRQACRIKLPLEALFHAPTVHALGQYLEQCFLAQAEGQGDSLRPSEDESAGASGAASEAPRTQVEIGLAKIWSRTLGVSDVARHANFFDLGGNSLLAVNLFMEIEKQFGKRLPLSTLFQARTLAELAHVLQQQDAAANWSSLVPIQPQGSRRPFFCVHAAGGNVLVYRDLARYLGEDYPFYGLQCQGLDGKQDYLRRIEDMAAKYLSEIRSLQPSGPYQLGGFCMGGTIALEIAQQLIKDGEKVSFLGFFDTYNYSQVQLPQSFREKLAFTCQKVRFHAANLARLGFKAQVAYFVEKFRMAKERELTRVALKLSNLSRRLNLLNPNTNFETLLEDLNEKIAHAYKPAVYPGKVTLFRPQQNYALYSDPQMGWANMIAGGLQVIELPVNPGGMFVEPYVRTVAENLKTCLDQSQ